MSKAKLNLGSLTVDQKIILGNNIKTAMTGNANFTTPNPTLAAYGTVITTLTTKNAAVVALKGQLKGAVLDSGVAEKAFDASTALLVAYVENTAAGDAVKIQSAGMGVRSSATPAGIPGQVMNLAVTAGDADGELDLQWDRVATAKTYEVQMSPDPMTGTSFVSKPSVTKSKTAITGLTSGQRMWARVRAIGSAGSGAWSDPAMKIVP